MYAFRFFSFLAVVAMLFASAADARGRYDRRYHDRFDLGDAIVGAAVLGGIIAVANAAKKNRDTRTAPPPAPPAPYPQDYPPGGYPAPDREDGYDDRGYGGSEWSYADPDYDRRFPSEREAVGACAAEAESLAGRYGAEARVSRIFDVSRGGEDYRVTGSVRIDDGRASRIEEATFSCYADAGRVTGFRFEEQTASRY